MIIFMAKCVNLLRKHDKAPEHVFSMKKINVYNKLASHNIAEMMV